MHVRALEPIQVFDVEPAISGSGGDHHGTGPDTLAIEQLQHMTIHAWVAVHIQTGYLVRNRHFDSELACLAGGSAHERHAADPGGEAEVVLDPSRGAGLAAKRPALENEDGETFRARVNSGRETSRPGSDDGDVVNPVLIDRADQANAACKLALRGIAQKLASWTEHDRQLSRIDVETLDESARFWIGLRVKPLVRMTVAGEKGGEPNYVTVADRTDNDRPANSSLDESNPAQDQRAHDALPDLRFGNQDRPEPIGRYDERLDRILRMGIDQRRLARQLGEFANERAGTVSS